MIEDFEHPRRRTTQHQVGAAFGKPGTPAQAPRRKSICGRNLNAGPGSCTFWYETCPANIAHCIQRFIRTNQHVSGDLAAEAAALAQWQTERDRAVQPQGELL